MNVYVSEVSERVRERENLVMPFVVDYVSHWTATTSSEVSEREIKCVYGESRIFLTISLSISLFFNTDLHLRRYVFGSPSFFSLTCWTWSCAKTKKTLYSRNSSIIAAFDQTHQLCLHAFMWYVWTRLQRPVN